MTKDDSDSVNSNIESLGSHGAMTWATRELGLLKMPQPPNHRRRRILILTVREAAKRVQLDVQRARRLAACHTVGLRSLGVKVALLLVVATSAAAQSVVYTNVVDGQRVNRVVRVVRVVGPAAPVPPSIFTTPTFDRWQFIEDLLRRAPATPPAQPQAPLTVAQSAPRRVEPFYYNGVYMGPSPSGQWTSVVQGPIELRLVGPVPVIRVQQTRPPAARPKQ